LSGILTNCRPAGGNPAQRLAPLTAGQAKPAKISFSFNGRAQKIFSIKETITPSRASRGRAGGQKFLPPDPLPFCPPAWASP